MGIYQELDVLVQNKADIKEAIEDMNPEVAPTGVMSQWPESIRSIQTGSPLSPYDSTPEMDGTGGAGSSNDYARGDHVHPSDTTKQAKITASGILKGDGSGGVSAAVSGTDYQAPLSKYSSTPAMDGTGAAGTSSAYAAGDHVHPTDTTRQAKITASGVLKGNGSGTISAAVAGTDYQAPLTFDDSPTSNSTNPVTSEGIRNALSFKVDKVGGKGLSSNDFTSAEKTKLSGIETGAQVNVQADWNATTAATGAIKNKPTIPTQVSPYTSTPEMDGTGNAGSSSNYAKGDHVHPTDTTRQAKITVSGLLKGDGTGTISAAVAGTDYQAPISKSTTTPAMDGSGSAGTSTSYAAGDHVHPTDTTRQSKITASGILKGDGTGSISAAVAGTDYQSPLTKYSSTPEMDGTGAAGTSTSYAAGDHVHPTDTTRQAKITASGLLKGNGSGTISAAVAGTDYQAPLSKSSTTPLMDGTGSAGTASTYAAGDHVHPTDTSRVAANSAITGATKCKITYDSKGLVTGGADLSGSDLPVATTSSFGAVKPDGTTITISSGVISAAGGSSISPSSSSPAMDGTASAGSSTSYARGDHVHPTDTSRQAALSEAQLEAVNSGITEDWVSSLDSDNSTLMENMYRIVDASIFVISEVVDLALNHRIYFINSTLASQLGSSIDIDFTRAINMAMDQEIAVDFMVDIIANGQVTVDFLGINDEFEIAIPSGEDLADMTTLPSQTYNRLYFTSAPNGLSSDGEMPVILFHKQTFSIKYSNDQE